MNHAPDVSRAALPRVDARLIMDDRGSIREANCQAHQLLGYAPGSLVGLSLAWITPPSRHALVAQLCDALRGGRRLSLSCPLLREDGRPLNVWLTASPCTSARGAELALTMEVHGEPAQASARDQARTRPILVPVGQPATLPAPAADNEITPRPGARAAASPGELVEHLATCMDLLGWLDTQLKKDGPREVLRDRALARVVLGEATSLLEQCREAVRGLASERPRA